jgi:hypothetical protein
MPSAAASLSLLAHAAAIGVLLVLRPPPPFAAPVEEIEVSVMTEVSPVSEGIAVRPRTNNLSDAVAGDKSAGTSATTLPSLTAMAAPPNRPGSLNAGRLFDPPDLSALKFHTPSLVPDMLGAMRDCPTVEDFAHGSSRRPRLARLPCMSAVLPLRIPGTVPTNASEPDGSGVRAADDYRTFKPDRSVADETLRSVLDESPFPDKVPPANSALKRWIFGLFR